MGSSKSKVRSLNPKTIKELQKNIDVDFSREEIEEWYKEYQVNLGKGMTRLTMKEFKEVYNSVFDGDASGFVEHLFRSFDMDRDGYVDFKEFIVGLCVSGSDKPNTKLKWAFRMYDVDGNGSISRGEMESMLKAIYRMITTDLSNSKDDIKAIDQLVSTFFESADKNHDDAINQEEFVQGVQEMPVFLHLLQCDPETGLEDVQTVEKFDSLAVSEKQSASNNDIKTEPKQETKNERKSAYMA